MIVRLWDLLARLWDLLTRRSLGTNMVAVCGVVTVICLASGWWLAAATWGIATAIWCLPGD